MAQLIKVCEAPLGKIKIPLLNVSDLQAKVLF